MREPAARGYFFGKGLSDIRNVLAESWSNNHKEASKCFEDVGHPRDHILVKIGRTTFNYTKGLTIYTFGTIVMLAISALFVFFLLIPWGIAIVMLLLASFIEFMTGWFRLLFFACPKCHEKHTLPYFQCPKCNAIHRRLRPGLYGILWRYCECGQILPTMWILGKSRLIALCPSAKCNADNTSPTIIGAGAHAPICIPLIGSPNAGKTCLIMSLTQSIEKELKKSHGFSIEFDLPEVEMMHKKLEKNFLQGIRPEKTSTNISFPPYRFLLHAPYWSQPRVIYLYDQPGEVFNDYTKMRSHLFFSYFSGIFILSDFGKTSNAFHQGANQSTHAKATAEQMNTISNVLTTIIGMTEKDGSKMKQPCALLLNKIDMLSISERKNLTESISSEDNNKTAENYFEKFGLANIWRVIQGNFLTKEIFPVSTLGREKDLSNVAFTPKGISQAFLWMLSKIDKSLTIPTFFSLPRRLTALLVDMVFAMTLMLGFSFLALDYKWENIIIALEAMPFGPNLYLILSYMTGHNIELSVLLQNIMSFYFYSTLFIIIIPTLWVKKSIGDLACDILPCTTTAPIVSLSQGSALLRKVIDVWSLGLSLLIPSKTQLRLSDTLINNIHLLQNSKTNKIYLAIVALLSLFTFLAMFFISCLSSIQGIILMLLVVALSTACVFWGYKNENLLANIFAVVGITLLTFLGWISKDAGVILAFQNSPSISWSVSIVSALVISPFLISSAWVLMFFDLNFFVLKKKSI